MLNHRNLKQFSLGLAPTLAHHDMATLALHQRGGRPEDFYKGQFGSASRSQHLLGLGAMKLASAGSLDEVEAYRDVGVPRFHLTFQFTQLLSPLAPK